MTREILERLVADGLSQREIAVRLNRSQSWVSRCMSTLGIGPAWAYRRGAASWNYRDGTTRDSNGYVVISAGAYKGRREHQIVAEQTLGRALLPTEIVHHRNHQKADNRPENLEVLPRVMHQREHLGRGQVLACRSCGREHWYSPAQLVMMRPENYHCRKCGGRWGTE